MTIRIPVVRTLVNKTRVYWLRYDTDRNGYVDYKEFIAKLGVEFASGDTDGHSRRIIDESYDTIMPEFKNKVPDFG